MRKHMLTLALILAATAATAADAPELLRIPLISGLYTVEAPGDWHLEESGKDLTATFSETKSSDGTLIIAAPNPLIEDARAYNRRTVEALLSKFKTGTITKEESTAEGENSARPTHTIWFAFKAGRGEKERAYLGLSRTTEYTEAGANTAVQAMALATMSHFAEFMQTAAPILASYEPAPGMLQKNTDLLTEVGQKILAAVEN